MKQDNKGLRVKVALRTSLLKEVEAPVVMETHGGKGLIWSRCYSQVEQGIVFEKNPAKTEVLGRQRPTWAVYEADCVEALKEGVGGHLEINVLDVDPYGDPWPILDAFFASERPRAKELILVVNDGLRQKVKLGGAWACGSINETSFFMSHGNQWMYENYLEFAREQITFLAAKAEYTLTQWMGRYAGHLKQMSHYGAKFQLGLVA